MATDRTIIIRDTVAIDAPLERMFRLSTSVPLVQRTLGFKPVEGVTNGHIVMGSKVLWKGWLFGFPQYHLTLITGYTAPETDAGGTGHAWFQDSQQAGRFRTFRHDHHHTQAPGGPTVLNDEIRYTLPFGVPGHLVARFVMQPFIRRTLRRRFELLRQTALSDDHKRYM